jgi:hypothetical protein
MEIDHHPSACMPSTACAPTQVNKITTQIPAWTVKAEPAEPIDPIAGEWAKAPEPRIHYPWATDDAVEPFPWPMDWIGKPKKMEWQFERMNQEDYRSHNRRKNKQILRAKHIKFEGKL